MVSLGSYFHIFVPISGHISGESIEAKTHEHVTMLFSDIVGFTSICSTATPFMVISMLENLYNKFDAFCGQLDVYKVGSNPDLDLLFFYLVRHRYKKHAIFLKFWERFWKKSKYQILNIVSN